MSSRSFFTRSSMSSRTLCMTSHGLPSGSPYGRPIVFFGLMRGGAKFIRGKTPHGYDHVGPLYHLVRELNRGLRRYIYALFGHSLYGAFVHYARGAGASALYLDLITSVGLCEAFRHLAPAGISHANEKYFFLARHIVLNFLLYHLFIIKAISLARAEPLTLNVSTCLLQFPSL